MAAGGGKQRDNIVAGAELLPVGPDGASFVKDIPGLVAQAPQLQIPHAHRGATVTPNLGD